MSELPILIGALLSMRLSPTSKSGSSRSPNARCYHSFVSSHCCLRLKSREFAWSIDVITIRAILTWAGRVADQTIASATSVGVSGIEPLINLRGTFGVSMEAHEAEIGFHHAGIDAGDAYRCSQHVLAQAIADGEFCRLGCAIDCAIGVSDLTCGRSRD